jgi:hypothetical protein
LRSDSWNSKFNETNALYLNLGKNLEERRYRRGF